MPFAPTNLFPREEMIMVTTAAIATAVFKPKAKAKYRSGGKERVRAGRN